MNFLHFFSLPFVRGKKSEDRPEEQIEIPKAAIVPSDPRAEIRVVEIHFGTFYEKSSPAEPSTSAGSNEFSTHPTDLSGELPRDLIARELGNLSRRFRNSISEISKTEGQMESEAFVGVDIGSGEDRVDITVLEFRLPGNCEQPIAEPKFCPQCEYYLHGKPPICQAVNLYVRTPSPPNVSIDCPDFSPIDRLRQAARNSALQRKVRYISDNCQSESDN